MNRLAVQSHRLLPIALTISLLAGLSACKEQADAKSEQIHPRSISYLTLKQSEPGRLDRVAGSVESWKKELVGFRVDGRVSEIAEPGAMIKGRLSDPSGKVVQAGTQIGSVENDHYRLRVSEAQARVKGIEAEAKAVRVDIKSTIPNELREVQAEFNRAKAELDRQNRLLKRGAGTQKRVDAAQAKFTSAEARLGQIRSKRSEKRAQLSSIEAQIAEARQVLRQTEIDLGDTALYAPFDGQISKVHVIPGGFVDKGQPVVTLQMMDPMKVQIAVSPNTDREINFNDVMKVHVDGEIEPLTGWVWNKDTVADASTRTFMVTLLVRNRQIEAGSSSETKATPTNRTDALWNVEAEHDDGRAPYFANELTLHQDEKGYFVWKAEGLTINDLDGDFSPVFTVKKVRIKPGSRRIKLLQVLSYREVTEFGGFDPQKDLMTGRLPDGVKDGDTIFLSRQRWMLRPGQIVRVDLHHGRSPTGFYVPARSVIADGDAHHVYVVEDQPDGLGKAVRVPVRLRASIGTLQAIEPIAENALSAGVKLIVDGAHYIRNGDLVTAYNEVEVSL